MPPFAEEGRKQRAISSGVERHVDIVEVAGSKPASPTNPPGEVNRGHERFDKSAKPIWTRDKSAGEPIWTTERSEVARRARCRMHLVNRAPKG